MTKMFRFTSCIPVQFFALLVLLIWCTFCSFHLFPLHSQFFCPVFYPTFSLLCIPFLLFILCHPFSFYFSMYSSMSLSLYSISFFFFFFHVSLFLVLSSCVSVSSFPSSPSF